MNKTAIEWLDGGYTWNPVTGCLHGCEYCYANGIAKRFGTLKKIEFDTLPDTIKEIDLGQKSIWEISKKLEGEIYPYDFTPTFHRYRLNKPQTVKKPKNVFVCSMADLFGNWIPDEWIQEVFKACEAATQHRYLFLTKNPNRYIELVGKGILPDARNYWYGSSTVYADIPYFYSNNHNVFTSIEPIQSEFNRGFPIIESNWVIIGAETGNRKGKVIPKREWIENIVNACRDSKVPVFLKNNLASVWGEPLIQEFPWKESNYGKDCN